MILELLPADPVGSWACPPSSPWRWAVARGPRRWRRGGTFDKVSNDVSMVLYAMPEFWLGMLLLVLFAVRTGWFPTGGFEDDGRSATGMTPDRPAHHMACRR